jgi:hypothetical protein
LSHAKLRGGRDNHAGAVSGFGLDFCAQIREKVYSPMGTPYDKSLRAAGLSVATPVRTTLPGVAEVPGMFT